MDELLNEYLQALYAIAKHLQEGAPSPGEGFWYPAARNVEGSIYFLFREEGNDQLVMWRAEGSPGAIDYFSVVSPWEEALSSYELRERIRAINGWLEEPQIDCLSSSEVEFLLGDDRR